MKQKRSENLFQISIETSREAEDAVGELLHRECLQSPCIWVHAESNMSVASVYLSEPPGDLRGRLNSSLQGLSAFGLRTGPSRIRIRRVPKSNWSESWKRHFRPIDIAGQLLVKPSWSRKLPRRNQAVVCIDPGLSFGTGQHATTHYCLSRIVAERIPERRQSFCDMGTGSGILAISAARLGYAPIEAFDFDPDCVRVAHENAILNAVETSVKVRRADVTKLPLKPVRHFNVLCANLIDSLLIQECHRITSRLAPDGSLVLAGILTTQFDGVEKVYTQLGWACIDRKSEKEWTSGTFRR